MTKYALIKSINIDKINCPSITCCFFDDTFEDVDLITLGVGERFFDLEFNGVLLSGSKSAMFTNYKTGGIKRYDESEKGDIIHYWEHKISGKLYSYTLPESEKLKMMKKLEKKI